MKLYSHQNVPWESREEKIENARNLAQETQKQEGKSRRPEDAELNQDWLSLVRVTTIYYCPLWELSQLFPDGSKL